MAITRNITVTITGTNGNYTSAFSDETVGREGEHLNTRLTFTLPSEWQMFIGTDAVFVVEYLNARGTTGRSIDTAFPANGLIADFNPTYDVPFDALYSPQTQFVFEVHDPVDAYTSDISRTEAYLATVLNSWDGGKVTSPYGNDIFAYLQSEIDDKVDKVTGYSLMEDADITDLTDGGETALHKHDDMYYTEAESDALLLGKVDVVAGKELTDNNFTDALLTKLNGIEALAEVNNISDVNATDLTDGGETSLHKHDSMYYTETETDALLADKVDRVSGKSLVSDTAITDLTDSGNSALHYHSSDRNADNHVDGSINKVYTAVEKAKLAGVEAGAEVNNISDTNAADLTDGGETALHKHNDMYYTKAQVDSADDLKVDKIDGYGLSENDFTDAYKSKLDGVEDGAEANNISDADATDLTDGGATVLHYHNTIGTYTISVLTQAQYNALETKDANTIYFIAG